MKQIHSFCRCFALLIILATTVIPRVAEAKEPKKLLVVTVTKGFRHSSIATAERVLGQLAATNGVFTVDYVRNDEDMAKKMTMENLRKYDGVIFANTTGDLPLPDKQGFLKWIESGKTFIGMHSATDTFRGHTPLDPYVEMIGGEFLTHPPGLYEVECINADPEHPACKHFGPNFVVKDEIYILNGFNRSKVHDLLYLEKHPSEKTPGYFPIAWCKEYGKGKLFYTSLGHSEAVWDSPAYQKHIIGGIQWALGLQKGSAKPHDREAKVK